MVTLLSPDGLSARYYVRAGAHPVYAHEDVLRASTRLIMRGELPGTESLSVTDRALVASQSLAGWVTRPEASRPADRVIWHRAFGSTRVQVGVAR